MVSRDLDLLAMCLNFLTSTVIAAENLLAKAAIALPLAHLGLRTIYRILAA